MSPPIADYFDPKLELDDCTSKTACGEHGTCNYLSLRKKYFCECWPNVYRAGIYHAGKNCTFDSHEDLDKVKDRSYEITKKYKAVVMTPKY